MQPLPCGAMLRADPSYLCLSFPYPCLSLSTAIYGGGFRRIRWAMNKKLTVFYPREEEFPGGSVPAYLRLSLAEAGCVPEESSALLTSARMDWHRVVQKNRGDLSVAVIATAGVEKTAARAGDPPLYEEKNHHFYPAGTINLMVLMNGALPEGIMARAFITITEGKTAALQDLGIASVYTGRPATGTATDGITFVTDPKGPAYTDAGTFSVLGSLLSGAAYEAVRSCLVDFDRPWNRFDSLVTAGPIDLSSLKKGQ